KRMGPELDELGEEEQLLRRSGAFVNRTGQGIQVVAQLQGDLVVSTSGRAEKTIPLQEEWVNGPYSLQVQGVLLDYNGREQRASKVISIGSKTKDCNLKLSLKKDFVEAGEEFQVQVQPIRDDGTEFQPQSTLVAMKLSPQTQQNFRGYGRYGYGNRYRYGYNQLGINGLQPHQRLRLLTARGSLNSGNGDWAALQPVAEMGFQRKMVTAVPVEKGKATLTITEPGAYKLVCLSHFSPERTIRNEIGVVVHEKEDAPKLVLRTDSDVLESGEPLTGEIHSRFAGARVLLTVRDSQGVKLWKAYTLRKSAARFRLSLPDGLRYGCTVEAQYLDGDGQTHLASRFVRVNPIDRLLTVKTEMKSVCRPGEEVRIGLQVNRREPVDLVVSVYDQSLLGIAADKSVDVRNFYLADERGRDAAAEDALRRRLQGITVKELVDKA
ncbi:MAG: hypothetical protein N2C14_05895, partial [Planctomycetales bacterium]